MDSIANTPPTRRRLIGWIFAGTASAALGPLPAAAKTWRVSLSEAEWRRRLSKDEYRVLREAATEQPFSSPLDKEKRKGTFVCAGCGNELYSSDTKFDSKTGWPSFWKPLPHAVGTSIEHKLGYPRTEVHCADCGGHLGHVFKDGPKPTGLRYCMNGLAMDFKPG